MACPVSQGPEVRQEAALDIVGVARGVRQRLLDAPLARHVRVPIRILAGGVSLPEFLVHHCLQDLSHFRRDSQRVPCLLLLIQAAAL